MARFFILIATLIVCAPAFAEMQLFTCERPAWDGKDGCGPNNTYSTHTFLVNTRDFHDHAFEADASDHMDEQPEYVYQGGKGCDVSLKAKYDYHYMVTPETITFVFAMLPKAPRDKLWTRVTLDRGTMTAVMSEVDHSAELTCKVETVGR